MLVEVRPLPQTKWHGKKDKESFAQPKAIEVLYDSNTGKYATGLTEEEAIEYGKKLGVDLSSDYDTESPHPFWSSKASWITLPNSTSLFDTSKPRDFVKVKNMKASKFVANSQKEYDEGKYPDATHVIFDEEEQASQDASKIQLKYKAIQIAMKMSNEDKVSMVQVLSNKSIKGRSANFIDKEIDAVIDTRAADFIRYATMGRDEVTVRAQVLEMLTKGILTKEASSIYYMGDLIGMDYEDAVKWFKDPNNQKLKVILLEQLNK